MLPDFANINQYSPRPQCPGSMSAYVITLTLVLEHYQGLPEWHALFDFSAKSSNMDLKSFIQNDALFHSLIDIYDKPVDKAIKIYFLHIDAPDKEARVFHPLNIFSFGIALSQIS